MLKRCSSAVGQAHCPRKSVGFPNLDTGPNPDPLLPYRPGGSARLASLGGGGHYAPSTPPGQMRQIGQDGVFLLESKKTVSSKVRKPWDIRSCKRTRYLLRRPVRTSNPDRQTTIRHPSGCVPGGSYRERRPLSLSREPGSR